MPRSGGKGVIAVPMKDLLADIKLKIGGNIGLPC